MIDAFDSDVLISAANGDARGHEVSRLIVESDTAIGSLILLPEVLGKPTRLGMTKELGILTGLLTLLDLKDLDQEVAEAAAAMAAAYRLRAADAIHLATAVVHGADRFHTGNRNDFGPHIDDIEVVWAR